MLGRLLSTTTGQKKLEKHTQKKPGEKKTSSWLWFPHPPATGGVNFGYPEGHQTTPEGKALIQRLREAFVATELPRFLGYFSAMLEAQPGRTGEHSRGGEVHG